MSKVGGKSGRTVKKHPVDWSEGKIQFQDSEIKNDIKMERGAKTGHFTVNGDVSTPRLLPPPALLHSHTIALCPALAL